MQAMQAEIESLRRLIDSHNRLCEKASDYTAKISCEELPGW